MSRDFIFATTSDICVLKEVAISVFDRVSEMGNGINCYCGNNGILLNSLDDCGVDDAGDFRDALNLFDVCPVSVPLEEFNIFYCQIFGDIFWANKFFINLNDLIIMINFPQIIIYRDVLSIVSKDMHYDWYKDEEGVAIVPKFS